MTTPMTVNGKDASPARAADPFLPSEVDRRAFMMRSAVIGAAAVMTGAAWTPEARAQQAEKEAAAKPQAAPKMGGELSSDLDVVKRSKGPVMTVADEFYKVGPGPSSSHTIGPMRITYDFYQRCTKLPADQLAKATGLKVHLFGSLSATGQGHGTHRAALAGLLGKEPATIDPAFLDQMAAKPDETYPCKIGDKTFNLSQKDVIYDATKGEFPHPNTMTCKLMAGDKVVFELEYYSPGGGFYEWKGYTPPKKGAPKYPYSTMKELRQHAEKNKLSIAEAMMANEMSISGRSETDINVFLDKIANAMINTVKAGLAVKEGVLPGPIKLQSKAATVWEPRPGRTIRAGQGHRPGFRLRAGRLGGKRPRPPRDHRAHRRLGRSHARDRFRPDPGGAQDPDGQDSRRPARRSRDRLPMQAQRHARGRRGRLPIRDRRGLGDGRRAHRPGV